MKRSFLIFLTSIFFWSSAQLIAQPVLLTDIQTTTTPTLTRTTFTLTNKTHGHVRSYTHPGRIEIEFSNTLLRTRFKKKIFEHANIKKMTQTWMRKGSLRFVFLLGADAHWITRYKSDSESGMIRLELDIISNQSKKNWQTHLNRLFQEGVHQTYYLLNEEINKREAILKSKPTISRESPKKTVQTKSVDYTAVKKNKMITIVLDAGHGGKDPGALGGQGTKEKQVVLQITKMLAAKINQQPYRRAVLTRNGDYYVPLRTRLKLARLVKADLFIAIHADAHYNREATGSSVYALSQHGASSEAARWLANRENYAELGTVSLNQLVDTDPMLRSVMVDLAQTATIDASLRLGQRLLESLDDISKLHHHAVERAPFVVLKSPDIPSILVETGFITNPFEERRLQNATYQRQLVAAMYQGIENYLQQ